MMRASDQTSGLPQRSRRTLTCFTVSLIACIFVIWITFARDRQLEWISKDCDKIIVSVIFCETHGDGIALVPQGNPTGEEYVERCIDIDEAHVRDVAKFVRDSTEGMPMQFARTDMIMVCFLRGEAEVLGVYKVYGRGPSFKQMVAMCIGYDSGVPSSTVCESWDEIMVKNESIVPERAFRDRHKP